MTSQTQNKFLAKASLLLIGLMGTAMAADTASKWKTELSASLKEGYDTNVYVTSNERVGYPIANVGSFVTTFNAKASASQAGLLGAGSSFSLGYTPQATWYHEATQENNVQHKVLLAAGSKNKPWSWSMDSTTTFTDGSHDSVRYNQYSAYGTATARDRRAQWIQNAKGFLRYDSADWFVRFAVSALNQNFLIKQNNPTGVFAGWQNWVDRYEANGGVDFGYRLSKDLFLVTGVREGVQHQGALPWLTTYCSNHYEQYLLGLEGKVLPWLTVSMSGGPDVRRYVKTNSGVSALNTTCLYFNGNATATLGAKDSLTFTGRQWRWLSSTGATAYDDKSFSLAWKHDISKEFGFVVTALVQQSAYTAPAAREDNVYCGIAQLKYGLTKQLTLTADYTAGRAENQISTTAAAGREYRRQVMGVGLSASF